MSDADCTPAVNHVA